MNELSAEQARIAHESREALERHLAKGEVLRSEKEPRPKPFEPNYKRLELAEEAAQILQSGPNTVEDLETAVDPQIQKMYEDLAARPHETLQRWIGTVPKPKANETPGQVFNSMTEALRKRFGDVEKN